MFNFVGIEPLILSTKERDDYNEELSNLVTQLSSHDVYELRNARMNGTLKAAKKDLKAIDRIIELEPIFLATYQRMLVKIVNKFCMKFKSVNLDQEDCLIDVLYKVSKACWRYNNKTRFSTFCHYIAVNEMKSLIKKNLRKKNKIVRDSVSLIQSVNGKEKTLEIKDERIKDVSCSLIQEEELQIIKNAVPLLTPKRQKIVQKMLKGTELRDIKGVNSRQNASSLFLAAVSNIRKKIA